MKKLIAVSIILTLFASFAVAQEIGLGTWSQAVFVPFGLYDKDDDNDTNNTWSSIGPYWGGRTQSPIRVNTTLSGSTDFAGFQIDLSYDGENSSGRFFTDNDNVKLWIKPVSMLKLTYGKMKEDFLRGKVGDFSKFAPFGFTGVWGVKNQDTIFRRFEPNHGFHVALTPVEGLYIGTSVDLTKGKPMDASGQGSPTTANDVWADNIQSGIGYTIANVGLIRAQYVGRGKTPQSINNDGRVEAAFAFTGVEGLTLDVGAKIPLYFGDELEADDDPNAPPALPVKDKDREGRELFQFAVGANFASGDFGVAAMVNAVFYDSVSGTKTDTPEFYAYLMPSYNLGAFKVGGEFGFDNKSTCNDKGDPKGALDIGAWIAKSVAGGEIQIGVMLGIPFGDYTDSTKTTTKDGQLRFSIPVAATVTF